MQHWRHETRKPSKNWVSPNGTSVWTVAKLAMVILLVSDMIPAIVGEQKFGSLRLCPAGGRPFQMAWNLACDMKKRKRRSVDDVVIGIPEASASSWLPHESTFVKRDQYRPATLSDIMQICCEVGCEIRDLLAYCDPFSGWNS